MTNVIEEIRNRLESLCYLGEEVLDNGTRLVAPAREIAPYAWRFVLFTGISANEVHELEMMLKVRLPRQYSNFLRVWNGASFFGYQIAIWGKRTSYERTGSRRWQPFDLVSLNRRSELPCNSPDSVVYFGNIDQGRKWVFFDTASESAGRVGSTPRDKFEPLNYWTDFDSWLSETFLSFWDTNETSP